MINVNEFKPGVTFKSEGSVFLVLDSTHSKSGRGQATVKVKVRNLETGSNVILSYTGGTKVEKAFIDTKNVQFLYMDSTSAHFMNNETFEQVELNIEMLGNDVNYLSEGVEVQLKTYGEKVIGLQLPKNITLEVIEAPEAVQGNTVTNATKKIKLSSGIEVDAPQFIKPGDRVSISTETGKYVGRE